MLLIIVSQPYTSFTLSQCFHLAALLKLTFGRFYLYTSVTYCVLYTYVYWVSGYHSFPTLPAYSASCFNERICFLSSDFGFVIFLVRQPKNGSGFFTLLHMHCTCIPRNMTLQLLIIFQISASRQNWKGGKFMQYKVKKKARAMNCFPLPVWTGLLSLFEQEWKPFRNPAKHCI